MPLQPHVASQQPVAPAIQPQLQPETAYIPPAPPQQQAPIAPASVFQAAKPAQPELEAKPPQEAPIAPVSVFQAAKPTQPEPQAKPQLQSTPVATKPVEPTPIPLSKPEPIAAPVSQPTPPTQTSVAIPAPVIESETTSRVTVSRAGSITEPFRMSRLDQRDHSETDFPWQRIPDALPMGLVVFNSQQDVIYVNSGHQNLLGVSVENFGGIEEWLENTCPNAEYAARVLNSWREHIWRKQLTRTFSLRSADQKLREIEFSAQLMDDGGLLLTQTDVTERRRNESQLKMGEKKFRAVFQNNPGGLLLVDRSGGILDANPVFEAFVGKSVNELRRMTLSDCLVPQDALRLRATEEKIAAGSKANQRGNDSIEVRFQRDGESSVTLPTNRLTLCPIRDDEGKTRMGMYFLEMPKGDVSSSHAPTPPVQPASDPKLEAELRQSHQQNMALMNLMPDLILLVDGQLKIIDVAPPTGNWSGKMPQKTWRGEEVGTVWPEFGKELAAQAHKANSETTVVTDLEFNEGGSTFRFAIAPCENERYLVTVKDTSEFEALKKAGSNWHATAIEKIEEPVLVTDLRGTIRDANPAAESVFGYKRVDLLGRGIAKLYSRDESTAKEFNNKLSAALNKNGSWQGRNKFYRKDGSRGVAELNFSSVKGDSGPKELLAVHREVVKKEHHSIPNLPPSAAKKGSSDLEHEKMQHRFRNQLQMVTSLFALENDHDEMDDKLDAGNRWQVRLRAIAQAHAHRYPQDDTVWIVPLIRSISDEVSAVTGRGPGRREVVVHGSDSFRVDAEMATAFSLMVGEIIRLSMKREVRGDGPELFLQLKKKSGSELSLVATSGAGGVLFPKAKDTSLGSLKSLVQQLRGRMQMTQNGGTQALSVIISSGVKLGDES